MKGENRNAKDKLDSLERAAKRAGALSLSGLVVLLGSFVYSYVQLREIDEQIEVKRRSLDSIETQLQFAMAWKDTLATANIRLQQVIQESSPGIADNHFVKPTSLRIEQDTSSNHGQEPPSAMERQVQQQLIVRVSTNALFSVGIARSSSRAVYNSIDSALGKAGFVTTRIVHNRSVGQLGGAPTITYFHTKNLGKANEIARILREDSGTTYRILLDSETVIPDGQERWYLVVRP